MRPADSVWQALGPTMAENAAGMEARRAVNRGAWLRPFEDDLRQEALMKMYVEVSKRDIQEYRARSEGERAVFLRLTARSACVDWIRKAARHYRRRAHLDEAWIDGVAALQDVTAPDGTLIADEMKMKIVDVFVDGLASMSAREHESVLWKLGLGPKPAIESSWTVRGCLDRGREKLLAASQRQGCAEWLGKDAFDRLFVR